MLVSLDLIRGLMYSNLSLRFEVFPGVGSSVDLTLDYSRTRSLGRFGSGLRVGYF